MTASKASQAKSKAASKPADETPELSENPTVADVENADNTAYSASDGAALQQRQQAEAEKLRAEREEHGNPDAEPLAAARSDATNNTDQRISGNPFLEAGQPTIEAEDGARVVVIRDAAIPVAPPLREGTVLPWHAQSADGHWSVNILAKWGPLVVEVTPKGWVGDAPLTASVEELDSLVEVLTKAKAAADKVNA